MGATMSYRKLAIAAFAAASLLMLPSLGAAEESVASLLEELKGADAVEGQKIERELDLIWSRSGSPTMDLLLRRGRDAMEAGELDVAVGHLSALTDHAPDFAEGWHLRAKVFFREEEFGLALADLQQAVALNPYNFQAVYGMALILEQTGRIPAALRGYQAVLNVFPEHEEAKAGRDRLARQVGESDI